MRLTLGAAATAYLGLPAGRASSQRPCKRTPVCEAGTRVCLASRPDGCPGCSHAVGKVLCGGAGQRQHGVLRRGLRLRLRTAQLLRDPSCACKPENTCQGINDPSVAGPKRNASCAAGKNRSAASSRAARRSAATRTRIASWASGSRLTRTSVRSPVGLGNSTARGAASAADHNEECCGDGCCSGQCCRGGGVAGAAPGSLVCGSSPGSCGCPGGHRCGEDCCPAGSECCRLSFSTDILKRFGGPRIGAARYSCCSPGLEKELLDGLESLPAPLVGVFRVERIGRWSAEAAMAESRPPRGSADALDALAGVANLAALASDRFRSGRPDSRSRRSVRARKPALAAISAGPGLDATAAQALNKLLTAEARAWTLVDAAAQAHARSLGAIRAHNARAAVSQARASGRFSAQAAKALRPLPGLRKAAATALQSAGTPEVTVSARQVLAFQTLRAPWRPACRPACPPQPTRSGQL